jgi:hypothetical protein
MDEKTEDFEEPKEQEEMTEEPVRNISMNSVPISTLREFKQFARVYAHNRYSIALRLLLDRSAVLEMFSQLELRIKALENRTYKEQLLEESGESSGRKPIMTFGGKRK